MREQRRHIGPIEPSENMETVMLGCFQLVEQRAVPSEDHRDPFSFQRFRSFRHGEHPLLGNEAPYGGDKEGFFGDIELRTEVAIGRFGSIGIRIDGVGQLSA